MKSWFNRNNKNTVRPVKTSNLLSHTVKGVGSIAQKNPMMAAGLSIIGASYIGTRGPGYLKKTSDSVLNGLYPGNMMPSGSGRFGTRTNNLQPAAIQGIRFNYRRS